MGHSQRRTRPAVLAVSMAMLGGCTSSPDTAAPAGSPVVVEPATSEAAAEAHLRVFLTDGITDEQQEALIADLTSDARVEGIFYESKEEAYANAKEMFADDPELVESLDPDSLPASFGVTLKDPSEYRTIIDDFSDRPGVDEVIEHANVEEAVSAATQGVFNYGS